MKFLKGELFNGPGGLSLGAKNAGFVHPETGEEWKIEHLWSNDYDSNACKTFGLNICGDENDESVHVGPVENLPIGDKSILGDIDCFAFGFPCNDYSNVGEKKGLEGTFGPLYSYGVKVLKLYQPKFFVAENVGGLQSANEGNAFIKILTELEEAGYNLTPHLYKFEEYGIPQARHRIIIVGIRNDLYEKGIKFKVPAPTTLASTDYKTSRDAILEPPIPEDAPNHEMPKHTKKVQEMLSYIPAGENAWYLGIPEELRLNVKGARLSSIYKRLDPNRPAYTVTGSGGGGTHMYHWSENRALTNRERARLQTFPDDFVFLGSKEAVRKQIGMAVPPEGAKIVFNAILKTFAGIEYDSIPPIAKLQLENLKGTKKESIKELVTAL
ncbi:DNA (cytosine-5-)-methyltransferase [Heyndrickxia sporothermodurans]|uniref:Cytosine-specific methyltransferase n=1 Tax=Heyndrickxia sporothermodurans TaxID=46224 RepID=A0AB37HJ34_9BACI|nr:DNA cytosine methyltransferase [Heyndrickxia sporothermodurans]MBL5782439.1 DNA cytosine methyltransferase [Heyndrickxia sporothermodurans]MBL5793596.1 DNA cytosine methyltransferase [Heyndrickxia sporothermodurans]MBL5804703.1 DNA cytosine methyltransferase [Heyndrickxia sporothermodurans]MBL5854609.1 DNA cytosine methyltransferase [Heyndrickxia sporothermodurans]MBL7247664.1 DNA cytosine methyltransferase [Heyndrickxia sporothermodurans]